MHPSVACHSSRYSRRKASKLSCWSIPLTISVPSNSSSWVMKLVCVNKECLELQWTHVECHYVPAMHCCGSQPLWMQLKQLLPSDPAPARRELSVAKKGKARGGGWTASRHARINLGASAAESRIQAGIQTALSIRLTGSASLEFFFQVIILPSENSLTKQETRTVRAVFIELWGGEDLCILFMYMCFAQTVNVASRKVSIYRTCSLSASSRCKFSANRSRRWGALQDTQPNPRD